MQNYLHELIFGALLGNIVLWIGIIKLLYKGYKRYDSHMHQHYQMWEDYLYRESLRRDRVEGNRQRQIHKAERNEHRRLLEENLDESTSN